MLACLWRICLISIALAVRESDSGHGQSNASTHSLKHLQIKAYWIRHGQSCANVLNDQWKKPSNPLQWVQGAQFALYSDPPLTDCAVSRAQKLGPLILREILGQNPKWKDRPSGPQWKGQILPLFSSVMVRAMETAVYNFPGMTLFPMTNIAEEGLTLDNIPRAWNDQHREHFPNSNAIQFLQDVNPLADDPDRAGPEKSDYPTFLKRFASTLAALQPLYAPLIEDGDVLPVIIVSHSNYMKKFLSCNAQRKPDNNEVWVQDYSFDVQNLHLSPGSCMMEFPVQVPAANETILCPSMVERCRKKPSKFADQCEDRKLEDLC